MNKNLRRENIKWELPYIDWLKFNFDGASKGNLGVSRVGVIARMENGEAIAIATKGFQMGLIM